MQGVLAASESDTFVHGLRPDVYVHGKLIGIVSGDRGRILSGSANLSWAALLAASSTSAAANVECGVLADVAAQDLRQLFVPPPPPSELI